MMMIELWCFPPHNSVRSRCVQSGLISIQLKMSSLYELLSKDNVVFRTYAFWTTVLLLKLLAMSILTGLQRFRTKVKSKFFVWNCLSRHWHWIEIASPPWLDIKHVICSSDKCLMNYSYCYCVLTGTGSNSLNVILDFCQSGRSDFEETEGEVWRSGCGASPSCSSQRLGEYHSFCAPGAPVRPHQSVCLPGHPAIPCRSDRSHRSHFGLCGLCYSSACSCPSLDRGLCHLNLHGNSIVLLLLCFVEDSRCSVCRRGGVCWNKVNGILRRNLQTLSYYLLSGGQTGQLYAHQYWIAVLSNRQARVVYYGT